MTAAQYVESYATVWSGIMLGMFLAFGFVALTWPWPRRWLFGMAITALVCTFLVRHLIYSLVVLP